MPKLIYTPTAWKPTADSQLIVERAEAICVEYDADGYDLTLRQLYYQFVSRGWLANTDRNYKNLGAIINKARMAGLIDWEHITDRTRSLLAMSHWSTPGSVIDSAASSYHLDHWADQDTRVEVWVEKEALAGVVARVANRWDCAYFSCRGYVSQSEQWRAGRRLGRYIRQGQGVIILHLGDHDPSGIDMTRDITDRLTNFIEFDLLRGGWDSDRVRSTMDEQFEVRRIALNMDQVIEYGPPPNPAKLTDSRSTAYIDEYGSESWELDALDPRTLDALIASHIEGIVDTGRYNAVAAQLEHEREGLQALAARPWYQVVDWLGEQE